MGFLGSLGKLATNHLGDIFDGAGRALGKGSQAAADNRSAGVESAALAEQLNQSRQRSFLEQMLAREQEGRAGSTDAWKKLQQAEYMTQAGPYTAPTVTSQGKPTQLASFGFGPKAATGNELAGADALKTEALKRLQGGNPMPEVKDPGQFQFDPNLMKPGMFERLAGLAGPVLSGLGGLRK